MRRAGAQDVHRLEPRLLVVARSTRRSAPTRRPAILEVLGLPARLDAALDGDTRRLAQRPGSPGVGACLGLPGTRCGGPPPRHRLGLGPPVGAQRLHTERVQAVRGGRRRRPRQRRLRHLRDPRLPQGRCVAAQMLGPVDVAAGHVAALALHAALVVGRRRGRRRRGGGGGGGGARRGAARGQRVRAAWPPGPALAAVGAVPRTAGAMPGALAVALVAPSVVAAVRRVARHGPRHGHVLLPPGVSEVHLLDAAGGAEAVVVRAQRAEVIPRHPLLRVAGRRVRLGELEQRLLRMRRGAVGVLLHFPQGALGRV